MARKKLLSSPKPRKRESATERYRRLLRGGIKRRQAKGQRFGTLYADINQMNWRELRKLVSPSKTGKGTYKGLEEYRKQYEKELDDFIERSIKEYEQQEFDAQAWYDDFGYEQTEEPPSYAEDNVDYVYYIIDRLSVNVPEYGVTPKGATFRREAEAVEWSIAHKEALIGMIYSAGGEHGLEAVGERLRQHSAEVEEAVDRILLAYKDENATYARLAEIIMGGYDAETAKLIGEIDNYEEPV